MFPGVSSSQDQLSLVCGRSPSLGSLRALKSQNLVGTRPATRAQRMHTHATVSKVHQKAFQFHVRLRALSACGSTPRPRPGTKKKGNAQSRCKHLIPRRSISFGTRTAGHRQEEAARPPLPCGDRETEGQGLNFCVSFPYSIIIVLNNKIIIFKLFILILILESQEVAKKCRWRARAQFSQPPHVKSLRSCITRIQHRNEETDKDITYRAYTGFTTFKCSGGCMSTSV